MFYATQVLGQEAVEILEYDNRSWGIKKEWSYFQKQTNGNWTYFQTSVCHGCNHGCSWYARIAARADLTGNLVKVFQQEDAALNTLITFAPNTTGEIEINECKTISAETTTTGCPTIQEPSSFGLADGA